MELKIFHSILHGQLRPWLRNNKKGKKYYQQFLTKPFMQPAKSMDEFAGELRQIFKDHPGLIRDESLDTYLREPDGEYSIAVTTPLIEVQLPQFRNAKTKFYHFLITNETTRITNNLLNAVTRDIKEVDRRFIINTIRPKIIEHLKTTGQTLKSFEDDKDSKFILEVLKWSLIRLLLETEELFEDYLNTVPSTDTEIFTEYLGDPVPENGYYSASDKLEEIRNKLASPEKVTSAVSETKEEYIRQNHFNFGYNGDSKKLKAVIKQLNVQVDLLNEEKTSEEDLHKVLTASNVTSELPKIYFNCETVQFRYIIDKLKPYFSNLTPASIEKAGLFYSKINNCIKAQNLYSNKVHNPKKQHIIDEALNHLQ